ncbi:KinB-signaling pathway activation protein [Bacillus solimangrovi]|uniref:KinB-signaling pathway activation protein n=1 Tax=Bacillus solimangrovi TaxID=1305675 RepID=A0A1E5LGL8_9BACI|nr:KinB-signaling pathway activation protein [Bacillus solimangrovi]OEH93228.1 KinB-signaling pathway activation protein [Bacillus solimangrovi]
MNSRKWVYLFFTTLMFGGVSSVITGFMVKWDEYAEVFSSLHVGEILGASIWFLGVGFIFSLISQMGFFAYLTIHRFGLGIFKSVSLWNKAQIVLIVFVFFDLVYFRYKTFLKPGETIVQYLLPAILILAFAVAVAYKKMKETNRDAFIPAVFFIFVVTIIEWFPALRVNELDWLWLMVFPLLICNAWQLLILHRLTGAKK